MEYNLIVTACILPLQIASTSAATKFADNINPFSLHLTHHSIDPEEQIITAYSNSAFEPQYYHQVVQDPKWIKAMQSLPPSKKSIGFNGSLRSNILPNGDVDKYKA